MLSVFLIIYIVCITQYLTVECRALCSAVRGIITGNMSWSNSLRKIGQYVISSTGASPELLISQPQTTTVAGWSQFGYGVSNMGCDITLFFYRKKNVLKGFSCILKADITPGLQKLEIILGNKVLQCAKQTCRAK